MFLQEALLRQTYSKERGGLPVLPDYALNPVSVHTVRNLLKGSCVRRRSLHESASLLARVGPQARAGYAERDDVAGHYRRKQRLSSILN